MDKFMRWAVFILAPIIAVIALSKTLPDAVAFNAFFAPVLAIANYLPAGVAALAFVLTGGAFVLFLAAMIRRFSGSGTSKSEDE